MFMVWGVTLPAATIGYFIDTVRELVGGAGGWPSNWSAFVNGIKLLVKKDDRFSSLVGHCYIAG